ncbi:hypothetical protein [Streptomyces millisiae]|uniref:Uncharacterized protein n=1 Tax=Streptomyces millisiae TaxID=3075542 RepID=A0ABU2LWC6_9ACTN|nr:hypothetical protein [Streptomyces sp. DSM 44918]MDT0321894.1 hypothetical protein [Streptomyces sp. DSM 44918]
MITTLETPSLDWGVSFDYTQPPEPLMDRRVEVLALGERQGMAAVRWLREQGEPVGAVRLCRQHHTLVVPVGRPLEVGRWRTGTSLACGIGRACKAQMWMWAEGFHKLPNPWAVAEALMATNPELGRPALGEPVTRTVWDR